MENTALASNHESLGHTLFAASLAKGFMVSSYCAGLAGTAGCDAAGADEAGGATGAGVAAGAGTGAVNRDAS